MVEPGRIVRGRLWGLIYAAACALELLARASEEKIFFRLDFCRQLFVRFPPRTYVRLESVRTYVESEIWYLRQGRFCCRIFI